MSLFDHISLAPADPILGLTASYFSDPREKKVNLGVGYYKDDSLKTPIMQSVKEAEKIILDSQPSKEYLPIEGDKLLIDKVGALVFGACFWESQRHRIAGFQTLGGTGALKIGGTFFEHLLARPLFLPSPTWPNHRAVFNGCRLSVAEYPYYEHKTAQIKCEMLCRLFEETVQQSIIVLHASCHNPTGCDPSMQQWSAIAESLAKNNHIPFFDFAYLGLGRGIEQDASAVRLFAQKDFEMCVAFSAAKCFSLYGERVGALFIVAKNSRNAEHIASRVKQLIRANYSNPPRHGAAIVAHILSDSLLRAKWQEELEGMRKRIYTLRNRFAQRLQTEGYDCDSIRQGLGMFTLLKSTPDQVQKLSREYGIYMPSDGRINICGLNEKNIDYVIEALKEIL